MKAKDNLKRLRLDHGFTQTELADRIGTSQRIISLWELGKTKPSKKYAQILSELYGVPKSELLMDL